MGEERRAVGVGLGTGKEVQKRISKNKVYMTCHGENYCYAYSEKLITDIKELHPKVWPPTLKIPVSINCFSFLLL